MWRQVMDDVIRKTLAGFEESLTAFGPRLLAMLMILVTGIVVAVLARLLLGRLLPKLGFDRFAARSGLKEALERGGVVRPPSAALASVLAWGLMAVFVLLAIGALDVAIAKDLVSRAFSYLPQILVALSLLVLGVLLAAFLRRSVLIAAVNAALPSARFLAGSVHVAILVLFVAMALEHLGVGRQVILVSFSTIFGGVVLALALAFGLAGKDLARGLLERLVKPSVERTDGDDGLRHL
jgi:mechanosensitive ion channel-like protein